MNRVLVLGAALLLPCPVAGGLGRGAWTRIPPDRLAPAGASATAYSPEQMQKDLDRYDQEVLKIKERACRRKSVCAPGDWCDKSAPGRLPRHL